ncbi:MAG TPA: NUDIX domain-containing protein [Oxalicibacterium sp.]|nr:NUDIX domain-containing protein [Oxalicibacterium sp.]
MRTIHKVGAFVIRQRSAQSAQLLLFTHVDYPDAPIQIPGGTMEAGEKPLDAAIRELLEESGTSPPLMRKLGTSTLPSNAIPGTVLRRHCYLFDGNALPDQWRHIVTGKGEDESLRFDYQWYSIGRDFRLAGDLGYFLHARAIPELY